MPRGFGGLEKIENRSEYRWALVRHLDGLRTHTHLWLNLSRAAMYILTKSAPCTRWSDRTGSYEHAHIKHARNFLACVGRLFTTPVGPLADRYRMLRERAGTIGIAGESSTSSGGWSSCQCRGRCGRRWAGSSSVSKAAWYGCTDLQCTLRFGSLGLLTSWIRRRCGQ